MFPQSIISHPFPFNRPPLLPLKLSLVDKLQLGRVFIATLPIRYLLVGAFRSFTLKGTTDLLVLKSVTLLYVLCSLPVPNSSVSLFLPASRLLVQFCRVLSTLHCRYFSVVAEAIKIHIGDLASWG